MTYRYTKEPTQRQLQVSEALRKGISEMLVRDSRISDYCDNILISIAEVRISPDLKLATIFFSLLSGREDGSEREKVEAILNNISNEFRKGLAKYIRLRYVPQLRFVYDEVNKKASEINKLIKNSDLKEDV